jgi:hypothetical protein
MDTKIVRMNGVPVRVPHEELTDPDKYSGEPCGATEPYWPDSEGGATCTLAPHETGPAGSAHIAHDGDWNVIAIWWGTIVADQDARSQYAFTERLLERAAQPGYERADVKLARLADAISDTAGATGDDASWLAGVVIATLESWRVDSGAYQVPGEGEPWDADAWLASLGREV